MPIDTTPSTVATNALQAIPFSSLIGGPLDACIKAQALAAKTSWEFINEVGLTIDPDTGEKKAINVTFQYNNNYQMTTLVVPLLAIVPIPYLAINTVDIDFTANISAASSSVTETTSDTSLGIDVTAEAAFKVGPFSLSIKANANYSSKQSSKASQDSKYSVEYTMGVKVSGGQADMPAGLATILNILQGSITSVGPGDLLTITPANLDLYQTPGGTLQVSIKTSQGVVAPGSRVTINVEGDSPFESIEVDNGATPQAIERQINAGHNLSIVGRAYKRKYLSGSAGGARLLAYHQGRAIGRETSTRTINLPVAGNNTNGNAPVQGITDKDGSVIFRFTLKKDVFRGDQNLQGKLLVTGDVPYTGQKGEQQFRPETQTVVYSIIPLPADPALTPSATSLAFTDADQSKPVTITAANSVDPSKKVANLNVTAVVSVDGAGTLAEIFSNIKVNGVDSGSLGTASGITAANGTIDFSFATRTGFTGSYSGQITFSSDQTEDVIVPFTANK